MRSERSTWRPLFRTTKKLWPLKTLRRRSFPPPLPIQRAEQVRNKSHHTSVLHFLFVASSPTYFLALFFPQTSFFLPLEPHRRLFLYHTPVHLLHLHSPLFFNAYTHWWISNNWPYLFIRSDWLQTHCFLHLLEPHSHYFVRLSAFFLNCIFPCNYLPMNISSLLNGSFRVLVCICISVCFLMSSLTNTLKIWPTNSSSSRMSAQPSYQSMMNRMENVSYLVLPTRTRSDRSATAPKSIRDCTFLLYWIPTHILFWQGKHFTILHHRCHVIFKYVRAYIF